MSTSGTSSFGGMLSTTYQPMSSMLLAAWDRPAAAHAGDEQHFEA